MTEHDLAAENERLRRACWRIYEICGFVEGREADAAMAFANTEDVGELAFLAAESLLESYEELYEEQSGGGDWREGLSDAEVGNLEDLATEIREAHERIGQNAERRQELELRMMMLRDADGDDDGG